MALQFLTPKDFKKMGELLKQTEARGKITMLAQRKRRRAQRKIRRAQKS